VPWEAVAGQRTEQIFDIAVDVESHLRLCAAGFCASPA
jgi:hypothetical protein